MKKYIPFLMILSACQSGVPSIGEINAPEVVESPSHIETSKEETQPPKSTPETETPTPQPPPSAEPQFKTGQPVTLAFDLTNISTSAFSSYSFSPYFGSSITVTKEGETTPIYQQSFFTSSQLFLPQSIQPKGLNTGDKFTVSLYGHSDGNCTNSFGLHLKPLEGSESKPFPLGYSFAYRTAKQTELKFKTEDFQRGVEDLSCVIGKTQKGTVRNGNDQPIVGAQVKAEVKDSRGIYYQNIQITDQNGMFSMMSLPSGGNIYLTVYHTDYHSKSSLVKLSDTNTKDWDLIMTKILP